jgi:hypothetical protein
MPDMELSESLRERIVETLGLPADAGSEAINAAIEDRLAQNAERAIAKAIANGAILPAHRDYWLNAFAKDRNGTEAVLASLTPRRTAPASARQSTGNPTYSAPDPRRALDDAEGDAAMWQIGGACRAGIEPPEKKITTLRNEDGTPYVPKQHLGF